MAHVHCTKDITRTKEFATSKYSRNWHLSCRYTGQGDQSRKRQYCIVCWFRHCLYPHLPPGISCSHSSLSAQKAGEWKEERIVAWLLLCEKGVNMGPVQMAVVAMGEPSSPLFSLLTWRIASSSTLKYRNEMMCSRSLASAHLNRLDQKYVSRGSTVAMNWIYQRCS